MGVKTFFLLETFNALKMILFGYTNIHIYYYYHYSFYNPQQYSTEDSIDLSKIPPVVPQKLIENSIDRFDAYGDYEYIDVEQHPQQQIQVNSIMIY